MRPLDVDAVALGGTQLVEASAGTGKTFAIAHLFLRLLIEPQGRAELEPRDILVVTYTKAATAELRARIRRRLREALAALRGAEPADDVLAALVARRRRAGQAESDVRHLEHCLRELDQAAIHTIHAFCQRALGDSPFRSGANFDVELLEDARPQLREIARDFWASRLAAAPAVLVAFLHEHEEHRLDIDTLARLAERIAAQPLAELLPGRPDAPPPEVPAEWHAALAELTELWPAARTAVPALLLAPGVMNKGIFKPQKVEQWLAQLDAQLRHARPGMSWRMKDFHRFGDDYVRAKTTRGAAKPEHLLFGACSRLLEIERALETGLAASALALRLEFAASVREALRSRLRAAGLQTFDDLLTGLHGALLAPGGGALAQELALRHPVALIDESQDTDPVQYEIFQRIWHAAGAPLFLIGDPKQAIYSFRGADVHAYLAARDDAEAQFTLDVSRRSDPALVRAINELFRRSDAPFAPEDIAYRALEPRPGTVDALAAPAFELLVSGDAAAVAGAVATEIARVLSDPPRLGERRLRADDIAVLCRTNDQARQVRDELHRRGVAAILQGDASVFQTEAAGDLERVARALAHPGDASRLRAALATPLLGMRAAELEELSQGGRSWEQWQERVQAAHETWRELGFSVALRRLLDESRNAGRLLGELGGERRLTDALQLGELMHLAERKLHLGPLALVRWLAAARAGAPGGGASDWLEDAQIRLESDADAVKLTTVHRSKGLEYGVVYVPFAWKKEDLRADEKDFARFHGDDGRIAFDLGSREPERTAHRTLAAQEARSEAMRLLYVAVTRARHGCRVVYARADRAHETALGRLLGAGADEACDALVQRLAAFGARALAAPELVRVAVPPAGAVGEARKLGRPLGLARRTSSYTGLVRRARAESAGRDHDAEVPSEGEGGLARGAAVGLALHQVLEHLDFPGAEPEGVRRAVERASALHGVDTGSAAALTRTVLYTLDTPLPPAGVLRLRDVTRAERIAELEFLVPVGDPRADASRLTAARLAEAFAQHAGRPELGRYAARLGRLDFAPLVGHLRGFVDLVVRKQGRWYLFDYKSNGLADYGPERVGAAMLEHHYVLQYHLYVLALHRWLGRRVPGYAYERDFGGVYYLFVRGMSPERELGSGVWFDRPPLALVEALGSALARSAGAA